MIIEYKEVVKILKALVYYVAAIRILKFIMFENLVKLSVKTTLSSMMARMNRKQIPVCKKCHIKIHQGVYDGKRSQIIRLIQF
jgi:hypothetical protein